MCCGVALATQGEVASPLVTLAPSDTNTEDRVVVKMRGRQFEPAQLLLQVGRITTLVLQNEDAELHAFVPGDLLVGVNLNIGGNGAPEFNDRGFKRVVIPSEGWAEIRFVPERTGVYPFFCDMPGHEMKATIVVQ